MSLALAATLAVTNASRARQEAAEARRQADLAVSRQLAASSQNLTAQDHDLSLLLAIAAFKRSATPEARGALLSGLLGSPHLTRHLHGAEGQVRDLAFAADNTRLVAGDQHGKLIVWSVPGGEVTQRVEVGHPVLSIASDRADRIAAGLTDRSIALWEMASGSDVVRLDDRFQGSEP